MDFKLARRNDWTYSEQLDNAAWTKTNATVSADAVAAPNGTTTADKLVEASDTSQSHLWSRDITSPTDDTDQTFTVFLKAAGRTAVHLSNRTKAGTFVTVNFDLSAGSYNNASPGATASITALDDDWYLCRFTWDVGSGGSTPNVRLYLRDGSGITYNGDGSSGVYCWGMQWHKDTDADSYGGYASTEGTAFTTGIGESPLLDHFELVQDAQEHVSRVSLVWQANTAGLAIAFGDDVIVDDRGTTVFVGTIVNIKRERLSGKPFIRATAFDYAHSMKKTSINSTTGVAYKAQSDRAIIQDLLTESGLDSNITSDNANVDIILSSIEAAYPADYSVFQAVDDIAARAGGRWTLDPNIAPADQVALHYNTTANAGYAAWDISDSPNETTTFKAIGLSLDEYYDKLGNTIRVVGGRDTFGRTVTATDSDATSITAYGERFLSFSSEEITTQDQADDIAAALLAAHKDPQKAVTFAVTKDGLGVNELIAVTDSDYNLSAEDFIIQTISTKVVRNGTNHQSVHRITAGSDRSNENRLIRQLQSLASGPNTSPVLLRGALVTGNTGYLEVDSAHASASLFQDASDGLTVSAWVRRDASSGGFHGIFSATNSSEAGSDGYVTFLYNSGTERRMRLKSNGVTWTAAANTGIPIDGQWHHICFAWNGSFGVGDVVMYKDGTSLSVSQTGSGSWTLDAAANLTMGNFQDMAVAQVAAWNIQLKDGDIQRLAARPDALIPPTIFPAHQVCYWRMDDFADGSTISNAVDQIQDIWNDFHAETKVTTSGDFGEGVESHWNPLL